MRIIMATNNAGKIRELKEMLEEYDVISQKEAGIDDLNVDENGMTFEENAIIKAKSIKDLVNDDSLIIAEDTGICIECLNGYPGVKSKRAPGEELGRKVNDFERNEFYIKKVGENTNRCMIWQTAVALIENDGSIKTFIGEVKGEIPKTQAGEDGFGFDPIFYIPEENKTLAQMNFEEKSNYSARKRAIEKLVKYLREKNK